jgi:hypothetical protein
MWCNGNTPTNTGEVLVFQVRPLGCCGFESRHGDKEGPCQSLDWWLALLMDYATATTTRDEESRHACLILAMSNAPRSVLVIVLFARGGEHGESISVRPQCVSEMNHLQPLSQLGVSVVPLLQLCPTHIYPKAACFSGGHFLNPRLIMTTTNSDRKWEAIDRFVEEACGPDAVTAPLGDLDNPIHNLFDRSSFYRTGRDRDGSEENYPMSDAAYEAITPALRLASMFITESKMLRPFDHVANGVMAINEDGDTYIRRGIAEFTPHGLEFVQAIFRLVTRRVRFYFAEREDVNAGHMAATVPYSWDLMDLSMDCPGQTYTRKVRDACARISFE